MTFSPELTYILKDRPHCIRDKRKGHRLVKRVNKLLDAVAALTNLSLRAKLDPFYVDDGSGKVTAWCVEIVPVTHLQMCWLEQDSPSHDLFMRSVNLIFEGLANMGLVPSVSRTTRRAGQLVRREFPTGGCHLHHGADLFRLGPNWYSQMERFHRNLMMDYANRPYIRWLLAQWSDNVNSLCLVTESDFKDPARLTPESIWARALDGTHAIEPRFMMASKTSHLTFEFRFINMVENAAELRAVALLINSWVNHICLLSLAGFTLSPTISRADILALKRLPKTPSIMPLLIECWLDSVLQSATLREELRPTLYTLYQRNYVNRVRFGQMV